MTDTKDLIMDTAERLFAEHGVAATSLRGIMTAAELNPASIHYHFGGKDALVQAVIARRMDPLNHERGRRFDELEAAASGGPIAIEDLIDAFVGPSLRMAASTEFDGRRFMSLLGRFHAESGEAARSILERQFRPIFERFAALLRPSVLHLSERSFAWRLHFLVGSMCHTLSCRQPWAWIADDADEFDCASARTQLVAFLADAFRAPVSVGEPQ